MLYLFAELMVGCLSGMVLGFAHQLWSFDESLGRVARGVELSCLCVLSVICVFLTLFFSFILTASMQGYVVSLLGVAISYLGMVRCFSLS